MGRANLLRPLLGEEPVVLQLPPLELDCQPEAGRLEPDDGPTTVYQHEHTEAHDDDDTADGSLREAKCKRSELMDRMARLAQVSSPVGRL